VLALVTGRTEEETEGMERVRTTGEWSERVTEETEV
jgi:hypothetical protein